MRKALLFSASLLMLAAVPARAVLAQELSGSFYNPNSGETFTVEGKGDGTADIYGSDGRHVGEAQDNGNGTWDIYSQSGRRLGEIQDSGDGSFEVYGSQGGYWGSGESE
jgi:hypothetical protein